jgi:hypothetical protein
VKTPGWYAVRIELAAAIGAPVLVGLAFLTAPYSLGGGWGLVDGETAWISVAAIALGLVTYVVGLAWMIRIYRADPEAHPSWWRAVRSR